MTYDKENMLGVLQTFSEQCKEAVRLARGVKIKGKFANICVCGMGGSGIGGKLYLHRPLVDHAGIAHRRRFLFAEDLIEFPTQTLEKE